MTKFCLAMEEHRRSEAGRVRTAREFVAHFFPHDDGKAKDQLFVHMPKEVRGPVLSAWGIRGAKAASRDEDDKVREVVHDALVAGDIDDATFEEGVTSQVLVDWIALPDWWSFWRQGKLSGVAIQKALATARELHLIDDKWFLLNVQGRGGKLKGTDVVCDTLSKDQIVAWVRKIHESGDGSAAGIVGAISWETVLAKTAQDALLFALDAFAKKVGLFVEPPPVEEKKPEAKLETKPETKSVRPAPPAAATAPAAATTNPAVATTPAASAVTAAHPKVPAEALTAKHDKVAEAYPTMNAPHDILAAAEAEVVKARVALAERERRDSGMTAPIPVAAATAHIVDDVPVEIEEDTPSIPTLGGAGQSEEESPKLKEARAAMMATLMQSGPGDVAANPRQAWGESDVPAKPSSLEWPAPPPGMVSVISPGTKTPVPAGPPSDEFLTFESLDDEMERPQARSAPPPLPKR
ncbi:hypothetical protein AKJ09_00894 [Labilithrix luteola]|uniref:Uncharacterized protein n=1 Tax=Labilithrix luteola TaxID=1391654 RepID=A0A0K1PL37_9BACT|nr:hypothetical protein AKJ09_00894 [Labilithrix luteola]